MPTSSVAASRLKNRVNPPDAPGLGGLLGLAVAVVIVAALSVAREVLVPLTLSVLLSFMLAPIVSMMRRIGVPRVPSVMVAILVAVGVVIVLGVVIGSQVAQLADDAPRYAATVEQKVSAVRTFAEGQVTAMTDRIGHVGPAPEAAPASRSAAPRQPKPLPVEVIQPGPAPLELAQELLLPVISPLATASIVFVVAIFILLQQEDLRDRIIRLFGSSDLHRTTAALDDAGARLGRYYLRLLAINTAFGAIIGAGLWLIGIPSPILWGIVAGLLRFIPYIGPIAGAAMPLALAAAVDPGWTMVLETLGLFFVVEPVIGQVVEPMVYGHSTGLSPVSVVIAAIFWGWIWGAIGLLLSMPLTLCLVVLGEHIERLEFLAVLLGNEPALTPAESLYQRMLAGDTDEALDQAETTLKAKSLSAYYDEVAIPGLRLAANDSLRGVLTPEQLRGILESISGVIVDLAEAEDGGAPDDLHAEWTGDSAVLCVSGRGPLDEAICSMLAQVLGKRGVRARVVAHESVARGHVGTLEMTGVKMICISYIEGANSLTALRYLIRRLRQRSQDAKLMLGLWDADPSLVADGRIQSAVGADIYVGSLRAAVDQCLVAARDPAARPELVA